MADAAPAPSATSSAMLPTYARAEVAFERGEGCWLTASDGARWLDFGAGIAVASVGHSHPHVVNALVEQGSGNIVLSEGGHLVTVLGADNLIGTVWGRGYMIRDIMPEDPGHVEPVAPAALVSYPAPVSNAA